MSDKPLCYAVLGSRGAGKTAWCVQTINAMRLPRLAIWDFKHDRRVGEIVGATPFTFLPTMARAMKAPTFRVRYLVDHKIDIAKQFDDFCDIAWTASQLLMYVCELPEVTTASRPPKIWRRCVNVGRDYTTPDGHPGWLAIMADAQRATEVDKSFLSNADVTHTGRQSYEDDAREMARRIGGGVTFEQLQQLPDLHWIERRAGEPEPRRGVLSFAGHAAKPSTKKISGAKAARGSALKEGA